MDYFNQSKEVFMSAYGRYDITIERGQGVYLYDTDNKEYLDFYSGIGVNALGYNNAIYLKNMTEQLHKVMHISNYFNSPSAIEAAKLLKEITELDKVFLCNSGTEATEGALKLARKYYYLKNNCADSEIISLQKSFHGRSTGSIRLTGNENYQRAFGPLIEGVKHATINDLESVVSLVNKKTAAIIVEVIQGEGGLMSCTTEFLQGIRKLCDDNDIVFIIDEVQTGMARTGKWMAYQHANIKPDIVCLAKGIGGGFPVGAMVANNKVGSALQPGDHGTTYGGNPLAGMAVASVLQIAKDTNLLDHVNDVSNYFTMKLDELVEKYDSILERRGYGLMQGLVFDHPIAQYIKSAQENGLLFVSAGPNIIRMLPPLVIDKKHVDQAIKIIEKIIK